VFAAVSIVLVPGAPYWFWIFASHLVSVPFSYATQAKLVFYRSVGWSALGKFFLFATVGLISNLILFPVVTEFLKLSKVWAQAVSLILIAVFSFVTSRFLIFRSGAGESA
jgi:putative flippase GtrA